MKTLPFQLLIALFVLGVLVACGSNAEPSRMTNQAMPPQNTAEPPAQPTPQPEADSIGIVPSNQASAETDRETLLFFYGNNGGPEWHGGTNWLDNLPLSEWLLVTTDGEGREIELDLEGNGATGETPAEISNLSYLEVLDLESNQFMEVSLPNWATLPNCGCWT